MNDTRQGNEGARNFAPLIGFALGTIMGAGLALLLAPASGEMTRQRLGNAARRVSRNARHALDDVREAATGLGTDVKSVIHAGREAFRHDDEPHGPRPASRNAQAPR